VRVKARSKTRIVAGSRLLGRYLGALSILALPGLLLPLSAAAALPRGVATALKRMDRGQADLARAWSYRKLLVTSKGSETLTYDPRRAPGKRWRIAQVNGKPPGAAERKRLVRQAETAAKAGRAAGLVLAPGWLRRSRYRLVEQTPRRLVYRIIPQVGTRGKIMTRNLLRHLSGRLVITRVGYWPVELVLGNSVPFSPRFGVRVTGVSFKIHFVRLAPAGPVVMAKTSIEVQGKVFWVKSFAAGTRVALSDFRPVAPVVAAPPAATGHGTS